MKYRIKYIKELRFEFSNHDHDKITDSNLILDTSFKESFDDNVLTIFLHCIYGIKKKEAAKQILHIDTIMAFEFDKLPKSKSKRNQVLNDLFPNLLGITISSMRGIIYTRTKGEPINEFVLPIINPTELVKERVERKPLQLQ